MLTIIHSTITDNQTPYVVGRFQFGAGGGIENASTGMLTLSFTTISHNTSYDGGGIDSSGTLTESHDTVSKNMATMGGGLYNNGAGQAEIDFSTLNDPTGGGIMNNGSTVHLKKTVVDGVLYVDENFI